MRKILLILCLLIVLSILVTGTAVAASGLPCDTNNDGQLTNGEVSNAVISYMKGDNSVKLDDARDAAHVLTYWDGKAFTFTDRKNNTITIYRPAKRVVDVEGSYGALTMVALGAKDKLVGVCDYALKPLELYPYVKDLPVTGTSKEPDVEMILGLNPDFVHAYPVYDMTAPRKALTAAGIPIAQIDCYIPEYYTEDLTIMGKVVGEEENASKLIAFEDYYYKLIADRLESLNDSGKPSVYLEILTNYMTGDATIDLIPKCGGVNAFADVATPTTVSSEEIIKRNPDVIIKIIYKGSDSTQDKYGSINESGFGAASDAGMKAYYQKLISRPGWDQIDAVKNGRTYLISSDSQSTHPCIYSLYIAKAIHPELFTDIDVDEIHGEWMKEFLGTDFTGMYAYPTPT